MKKVILISWYFEPDSRVGGKRIAYWFDYLKHSEGVECHAITGFEGADGDNLHVVMPDDKNRFLYKFFKFDPSARWIAPLKRFIRYKADLFEDADAVIMTGGPFVYFILSRYIKSVSNATIIMDYRDPYSMNPLTKSNLIKNLIKKALEKRFIQNADAIISVNRFCFKYICAPSKVKTFVIDNGYDEKIFSSVSAKSHVENAICYKLCYVGKFGSGRDAAALVGKVLGSSDITLEYAGTERLPESENIGHNGVLPYAEALDLINSCDAGIIFVEGLDFESTTKVFDYIAKRKPILVIMNKSLVEGSLIDISKRYPFIVFSRNNSADLTVAISALKRVRVPGDFDISSFARMAGAEKLLAVLSEV